MKRVMTIGIILFGAAALAFGLPPSVQAQDSPEIAPIEPVPRVLNPGLLEVAPEVPGEDFFAEGILDEVGDGEVVVNDTLWPLSPTVTYFKQATGFPALRSEFVAGVWVGFYVDENEMISSLWLLSSPPE